MSGDWRSLPAYGGAEGDQGLAVKKVFGSFGCGFAAPGVLPFTPIAWFRLRSASPGFAP